MRRYAKRPRTNTTRPAPTPHWQPRTGGLLALQRTIGNQAVQRLLISQRASEQIQRKKFTTEEYQWIADVWDLPEIQLLFQAYDNLPGPVLHRVSSLSGSEGSTKDANISIADRTYEDRETYVNEAGKSVAATDEQEFKSTLLHELLHFFFNHTQDLDTSQIITPKVMQEMLINPTKFGAGPMAYGWFQHPKSDYILHFDISETNNLLMEDYYVDPESALGKFKASGAYEHSPMPRSGNDVSPEEDLAAVTSLYLTSKESRNTLKAQYPKRYNMISGYFDRILPGIVSAKRKAEAAG
jgi:hypothetical protein